MDPTVDRLDALIADPADEELLRPGAAALVDEDGEWPLMGRPSHPGGDDDAVHPLERLDRAILAGLISP